MRPKMNKKHKAETAPATGRVYYGFTKANREDQPAWFHTPMAAKRFANACWPGSNYLVDTTTAPDPKDIMDTPEKPWYATNQTAEAAPAPSGQHTPGPWFQEGDAIWGGYGPGSKGVVRVAIPVAFTSEKDDSTYKANAALIAQAPQLLTENQALKAQVQKLREALQSMLEVSSCRSLSNVGGRGSVQSPAMRPAYGNHTATACDCCSCEAAIQARTAYDLEVVP